MPPPLPSPKNYNRYGLFHTGSAPPDGLVDGKRLPETDKAYQPELDAWELGSHLLKESKVTSACPVPDKRYRRATAHRYFF